MSCLRKDSEGFSTIRDFKFGPLSLFDLVMILSLTNLLKNGMFIGTKIDYLDKQMIKLVMLQAFIPSLSSTHICLRYGQDDQRHANPAPFPSNNIFLDSRSAFNHSYSSSTCLKFLYEWMPLHLIKSVSRNFDSLIVVQAVTNIDLPRNAILILFVVIATAMCYEMRREIDLKRPVSATSYLSASLIAAR